MHSTTTKAPQDMPQAVGWTGGYKSAWASTDCSMAIQVAHITFLQQGPGLIDPACSLDHLARLCSL
jgi:hypothetical protein